MNANAESCLSIFEKKIQLEVPLFQRQYVWTKELQWEPLWEDISRKFTDYLEGRTDSPVHFLGAMVLDQLQTPAVFVEKRQIIDGQQRLITLQIVLSAFRDFCYKQNCVELAEEFDSFVLNKGKMPNQDLDKYKVLPTKSDVDLFTKVITYKSYDNLLKEFPPKFRPRSKAKIPRPSIIEAYFYFFDQIKEFFAGSNDGTVQNTEELSLDEKVDRCFQALRNSLKVVFIDLENEDDAQVIFETLNARGEPLLPADLLRNYIFLRAARHNEPQEELYRTYWEKFDDPFWRHQIRQGRLNRPRIDLFMQHFLASRRAVDIPVKHLFAEYKYWIEKEKPFTSVRNELITLDSQREHFRRLIEPRHGDILFPLVTFLESFEVRTALPLLLSMLSKELSEECWKQTSTILESYLLRRAVCGLSSKNYNRIFLGLTKELMDGVITPERVYEYFVKLSGSSVEWPNDATFSAAWLSNHAYQVLNNPKVVYILKRISDSYINETNEHITINRPLTVEHILPQNWITNWPLDDGSKGLTYPELLEIGKNKKNGEKNPREEATNRRNSLMQTFGNLTILTQSLNSTVSNGSWAHKKPALLNASLLPINQQLHTYEKWNDESIENRGRELLNRAINIWPYNLA